MVTEYYIDLTEAPPNFEDVLIENGGQRLRSSDAGKIYYTRTRKINDDDTILVFGHRKVHYYAGSKSVRVFFNETNKDVGVMLLLKWHDLIFKHNLEKDI